tara:strand:- start:401 stop:685 length:285 start_codon:yes stop_codon:yes gene_type:complete
MKKYFTRSNILAVMVTLILLGYIGINYYKLHKEKVIYVIGMCAKENRSEFSDIKNVDHIRKAMVENKRFYRRFQDCEVIYSKAPKAMELKYPKD